MIRFFKFVLSHNILFFWWDLKCFMIFLLFLDYFCLCFRNEKNVRLNVLVLKKKNRINVSNYILVILLKCTGSREIKLNKVESKKKKTFIYSHKMSYSAAVSAREFILNGVKSVPKCANPGKLNCWLYLLKFKKNINT